VTAEPDERKGRVPASTDDEIDQEQRRVNLRESKDDLTLRKRFAYGAMGLMLVQVAAANYIFYLYGSALKWQIPAVAMTGWLTATVVQLVSVVLVVARNLFPRRDK